MLKLKTIVLYLVILDSFSRNPSPRAIETEAFPIVCDPVDPRTRKTKINPFVHKPMDLPVPKWDTEQGQCKLHGTKKLVYRKNIDELKHYLREYLKVIKKDEHHHSLKPSDVSNLPSELYTDSSK